MTVSFGVLACGPLRARPTRLRVPPEAGWWLVLLVTVDRERAGRRVSLGLPVALTAALAGPDLLDGLAGVLPGGPLGWLVRHRAQRPGGVGDLVAAAVVLDGGSGLPGPPAPSRLRHRAELLAQVGGWVVLG